MTLVSIHLVEKWVMISEVEGVLTKNQEFPCASTYSTILGKREGAHTTSLIPINMATKLLLLFHGASAGGGDKN